MKIGVIGSMGCVGQAVYNGLIRHHQVVGYDIKNKRVSIYEEILKTEMVFMCLPTPTLKNGQDLSVIERSLRNLNVREYKGIVVIKSTVLPGSCEKFKKNFPNLTIVHNPEFLSQKTANNDFENQKEIVLGGWDDDALKEVFRAHKPLGVKRARVGTPVQSELIKYLHNVFLTVKVGVLNELYDVCSEHGAEFQPLMDVAADITGWINKRHISVPNEGKFGYGGECFPKDIGALYEKYKFLNLDIIGECIESNGRRRKDAKNLIRKPLNIIEDKANVSQRTNRRSRQQRATPGKVRTSKVSR
jgi:nucleotide sugar dehydrogenase